VPNAGAPISTEYLEPASGVLGAVLPTGSVCDRVRTPVGELEVSLLDVTHPYAFVRAADLGLDLSAASPPALNADTAVRARLEQVRASCAVQLGLAADVEAATANSPVVPRLILLQESGPDDEAELLALGVSMGAVHHALPMTGALCLAAAAAVPGTLPHRLRAGRGVEPGTVRVRHPKGVVVLTADVDAAACPPHVRAVGVVRTARRLLAGTAFLRTPFMQAAP
jgi:2-methylaconitate cis-trans-isomerase PrpF